MAGRRTIRVEVEEPHPLRMCDIPDCANEGAHRAPRSRNSLTEYYWFCLEHVRGYNAQWDYFAGMSEDEVEAFIVADINGHRPTWPMGVPRGDGPRARGDGFKDSYGVFGADGGAPDAPAIELPTNERDALATMNLERTATPEEIKDRFKALVKQLHPDVNGRDSAAEERLRVVIEAYRLLVRQHYA